MRLTAATSTELAATAAARWAVFAWAGDVDGEGASTELRAIERRDGLLGFFRRAHGDEAEPARAPADTVHHQVCFRDGAMRRKSVLQVIFSCFVGKISYKQFIAHVMFGCEINRCSGHAVPVYRISNHH